MMSKIRLLLLVALFSSPALAQNFAYNGQCSQGGQLVVTQGLANSATQPIGGLPFIGGSVVGSFPNCTVKVFLTGTTTPATIFQDVSGTALGNPFTANGDGSFLFWAIAGGYDIQLSGGGMSTPRTLSGVQLGGGGGGGGSSFYQKIQVSGAATWAQQGVLNFIPGSNQSIACANNTLNGSTDCTFASTGGGLLSFNGRTASAALPVLTDYQGMTQVGNTTMTISKTPGGTLVLGSAAANLTILSDTAPSVKIGMSDIKGNYLLLGLGNSGNGLVQMGTNGTSLVGANLWLDSESGAPAIRMLFGVNASIEDYTFNDTSALFSRPLNLTSGLQFNGNPGLTTQCALGGGVGWGSCTSGTVGSVTGNAGRIVVTGTTSVNVDIANPFNPPGNVGITQFTNGSNALTLTANTPTSPTGNLLQCLTAGLAAVCSIDIAGNGTFNSLTTNGTGAGLIALTAGTDNSSLCTANSKCLESGTSIATSWTEVSESAGPSVYSIRGFAALSSAKTQSAYIPTTDASAPTFIQTGVVGNQSALSGVITVFDGGGNTSPATLNVSQIGGSGCASASVAVAIKCGSVQALAQSGNLTATNILTGTAAAGMYQLSVYLNGVTACATPGPGQFAAKIAYTDSNGSVTRTAATLTFAALPDQQPAVIAFWLQSSTSTINVSGTYTACTTGTFALDENFTLLRIQ